MSRKNAGNCSVNGVLPWHEAITNLHKALLEMKPVTHRPIINIGNSHCQLYLIQTHTATYGSKWVLRPQSQAIKTHYASRIWNMFLEVQSWSLEECFFLLCKQKKFPYKPIWRKCLSFTYIVILGKFKRH